MKHLTYTITRALCALLVVLLFGNASADVMTLPLCDPDRGGLYDSDKDTITQDGVECRRAPVERQCQRTRHILAHAEKRADGKWIGGDDIGRCIMNDLQVRNEKSRRADMAHYEQRQMVKQAKRVVGWAVGIIALLLILYYARDAYKAVIRAHIRVRREAESDLDGKGKSP